MFGLKWKLIFDNVKKTNTYDLFDIYPLIINAAVTPLTQCRDEKTHIEYAVGFIHTTERTKTFAVPDTVMNSRWSTQSTPNDLPTTLSTMMQTVIHMPKRKGSGVRSVWLHHMRPKSKENEAMNFTRTIGTHVYEKDGETRFILVDHSGSAYDEQGIPRNPRETSYFLLISKKLLSLNVCESELLNLNQANYEKGVLLGLGGEDRKKARNASHMSTLITIPAQKFLPIPGGYKMFRRAFLSNCSTALMMCGIISSAMWLPILEESKEWNLTVNPIINIFGPHDSGKTTWASYFLCIMGANPASYPLIHSTTGTVHCMFFFFDFTDYFSHFIPLSKAIQHRSMDCPVFPIVHDDLDKNRTSMRIDKDMTSMAFRLANRMMSETLAGNQKHTTGFQIVITETAIIAREEFAKPENKGGGSRFSGLLFDHLEGSEKPTVEHRNILLHAVTGELYSGRQVGTINLLLTCYQYCFILLVFAHTLYAPQVRNPANHGPISSLLFREWTPCRS
jgi:hypothetical protein